MLSKSVQLVFNNPHDMDENNEVDRTLWCGNLADEITEECLYELFLQVKNIVLYYRSVSYLVKPKHRCIGQSVF